MKEAFFCLRNEITVQLLLICVYYKLRQDKIERQAVCCLVHNGNRIRFDVLPDRAAAMCWVLSVGFVFLGRVAPGRESRRTGQTNQGLPCSG